MPFTKEQAIELKAQLKKAQRKILPFFYCQAGEDGEPILLIDRRAPSLSRPLRQRAQRKKFVTGSVQMLPNGVLGFLTESPPSEGKFERNLKMYFGKLLPPLKKMPIVNDEQFDALEEEANQKKRAALTQELNTKRALFEADPKQLSFKECEGLMSLIGHLQSLGNDDDALDELDDQIDIELTYRVRVREAQKRAKKALSGLEKNTAKAEAALKELTAPTESNIKTKLKIQKSLLNQLRKLRAARETILKAQAAR